MRCTVQNILENYERVQRVVLGLKVMDNMKNNRKVQFLGRLMILLKLNFCSGTLLSICLLGGPSIHATKLQHI